MPDVTPIGEEGAQSGRVNVAAPQSGRVNVGASAQSGRINVRGPVSGRVNVGAAAQSGRVNVVSPQSGRINVHSPSPQSGRVNVARAQSGRVNVRTPSPQSGRVNVYSGMPPPAGNPGAVPPGSIGINVLGNGSGEITFSCDFSVDVVWVKDGYSASYILQIGTGLGTSVFLNLTDYGGCRVGFDPIDGADLGLGGSHCPAPYLDPTGSGPPLFYTSADQYIFYGVREDPPGSGNLVSCDPNANPALVGIYNGGTGLSGVSYIPITDGQKFSMSGHFEMGIKASEYKNFTWHGEKSGTGEPMGALAYVGIAVPGYPWRYTSSVSSQWGKDPEYSNFPDAPSGSYGVGQRNHYANPYPPRGTPSSITYDSNSQVQTEATAGFGTYGGRLTAVYDGHLTPSSAHRRVTATFSNITFSSGTWKPLPYDGDYTAGGSAPIGHLTVKDGYLKADGCPFDVNAASATPAQITANLYYGDALQTGDQRMVFGSVDIETGVVQTGPTQTSAPPVSLTAHGGALNASLPQIRSSYAMDRGSGAPFWNPGLPANRDDYVFKGINLLPYSSGDYLVWLLDDAVWDCTKFTHAASVVLDDFSSADGWTATAGTVSGPNLTLSATGSGFAARRGPGYGKDCRNYRYLRLDVTSSAEGGPLTLTINSGAKTFLTKPLVAGAQTLEIDLCRPQGVSGASMTRTGWDKTPDPVYGVQNIDRLSIVGVASGQTVTISALTLFRKGSGCPGSAWPEATRVPANVSPQAEWYPPDVPAPVVTCPGATEDPDSIYAELTSANHLYARLLRNRADGKLCADLPHAVGNYNFADPYDFRSRPLGYVKAGERLMVPDFVDVVNRQTGLSCTAAIDGPNGYAANRMFAIFLTLDDYITAAKPDLDTNGATLKCRPFFTGIKTYPGQFAHCRYAFLKRTGCVVDGLVVSPDGSSRGNFRVALASCRTGSLTPPQTVTSDADGYYRFGAVPAGELFTVKTASATGFALAHPRALRWIGLTGGSSPFNPSNYQDDWGRYHRVLVHDGNVTYWRSDFAVPLPSWALAAVAVTSGGMDSYPRLAMDRRGILHCVFTRRESDSSQNLYRMVSWDDGATWGNGSAAGAATMAILGGIKGTCAVGVDGTYIEAAVVQGTNTILRARKQATGDVGLSDEYTFVDHNGDALSVEDDTFHLQQGRDGSARWLLHVAIAGEDATSDWYSSDVDARSWTRIVPT